MQLVAVGAQDVYLTGNPQITLFKGVYKRHTNFSMEPIPLTPSGDAGWGKTAEITVTRNADLVGEMWLRLEIKADDNSKLNKNPKHPQVPFGNNIIDFIELEIGGQKIDKHYGEWLSMDLALNEPSENLYRMSELVHGTGGHCNDKDAVDVVYVPLRFWFNKYKNLPLPLIALQYHEVKITVKFHNEASNIVVGGKNTASGSFSSAELITNYIYLDTEERKRFAQLSHEYLIEQVQSNRNNTMATSTNSTVKVDLNFNHPCKYLAWQTSDNRYTPRYSSKTSGNESFDTQLKLNGQDRFHKALDQEYFHKCQKVSHFTNSSDLQVSKNLTMGTVNSDSSEINEASEAFNTNCYVYSFAMNASEHQPSGTCNFSRIDNSQLVLTRTGSGKALANSIDVYAVNYNVLRIMSGMGGLAYSN